MALRTRYWINCQVVNWAKMFEFIPVGYHEVVPGDTISGKVTVDVHSAPTVRNINTRAYVDIAAFYMPFRLLWDPWPDFISGRDTVALPTVNNTFDANLETRVVGGSNLAFQRQMYNTVFNSHFSELGSSSFNDTNISVRVGLHRPTTFEVAKPPLDNESQDITAATTVDDLREAFALDSFEKTRQFYGDRYIDYLRALGVRTPWTVLEEAEVIGKKNEDWRYRMVSSTEGSGGGELGINAGYFKSQHIVDIRDSFIPEHGLIGVYMMAKADPLYETAPQYPHLNKSQLSDFWSPEFSMAKEQDWDAGLLDPAGEKVVRPKWEEYRKGLNTSSDISAGTQANEIMAFSNPLVAVQPDPADYDDHFDTTRMIGNNHYQATAEWRLRKNSPIPRHGVQPPIR